MPWFWAGFRRGSNKMYGPRRRRMRRRRLLRKLHKLRAAKAKSLSSGGPLGRLHRGRTRARTGGAALLYWTRHGGDRTVTSRRGCRARHRGAWALASAYRGTRRQTCGCCRGSRVLGSDPGRQRLGVRHTHSSASERAWGSFDKDGALSGASGGTVARHRRGRWRCATRVFDDIRGKATRRGGSSPREWRATWPSSGIDSAFRPSLRRNLLAIA